MYCAYHPINVATVQCSNCGRALCPACDHRIKGYAYCQDCIVSGVGRLSQPLPVQRPSQPQMPLYRARPGRAALFALIPGLGAVYNRQNSKALVHFLSVAGLFECANASNLGIFFFGGLAFYLYSILDAYRTAEAMQMGIDVSEDEARLRTSIRQHGRAWGGLLVLLGAIMLIANLNIFHFDLSVHRVWPVMLIVIGGVFLQDYFRHRKDTGMDFGATKMPRSVVTHSLPLPSLTAETETQHSYEHRRN